MTNKTLYKNLILDYLRKNGKSSLYDIWQSSDKAIGEVLFEEIVQSLVDDGLIEKVGETAIPTVVEDENGQLLYAPDILNDPTFFEVYKYKAKDNQNDEDGDLLLSHSREAFLQANS